MMWIWIIFGTCAGFWMGLILGGTITGYRRVKKIEYTRVQGVEKALFLIRHQNSEVRWHSVELDSVDEPDTANNDTNP